MKFIVDECVSRSVANWLQERFDTIYVQDYMPGATDHEVLRCATENNRIIVTQDKDFGDIVFRDKALHPGVILLRLKVKLPSNQKLVLEKVITDYFEELNSNFIVATDNSIKIIKFLSN